MNRSRIAALRDGAPDELLLRVMTLIGKHQKQYQPEQAEGAHEDALDGAASADADGGKSGLGTAAAEEVVKVRACVRSQCNCGLIRWSFLSSSGVRCPEALQSQARRKA